MTETEIVPRKPDRPPASKPVVDAELADELLARAQTDGVELLGPDGLLSQVTKAVLQRALGEEMSQHLGYDKHDCECWIWLTWGRLAGLASAASLLVVTPSTIGPTRVLLPGLVRSRRVADANPAHLGDLIRRLPDRGSWLITVLPRSDFLPGPAPAVSGRTHVPDGRKSARRAYRLSRILARSSLALTLMPVLMTSRFWSPQLANW